ncbi:MAG TPA: polysaccharide biosynthesis/export family protein [Candidatus Aquilonibacter sp.]|nr:polysaccharide biosynthesis/export family protein [Candidatus Aquilonibacter sp.]
MESGRFSLARSGGAFVLAVCLLGGVPSWLWGQQAPTSSPPSAPPIPAAQTVQQAAESATAKDQDATKPAGTPAPATADTADNSDSSLLKLSPGDLVDVSVYNVPDLSTKARVSNSGDIYLPLIDYVHIGDLTVDEAQSVIEKRLTDGGFVRSPHVTIFVDESTAQGVTILGEVAKPGIYPVVGDRKLYDVISTAGGFTQTAGRNISIIRHGQSKAITVKLPRNLADDLQANVDIFPGDTITIPRAPVIYVVGDVGRPSGLLVDNGTLTVLQAIALAGGTNHTAKLNAVRIVRKTPTGMTETRVPLKKMLEAKAPDITLQADDILFVPVSGGKVLAGRTFEAAMSAATAVSIYAVHP